MKIELKASVIAVLAVVPAALALGAGVVWGQFIAMCVRNGEFGKL